MILGISIVLIVLSGIAYRVLAGRMESEISTPIKLPVPLSEFPIKVAGWSGKDVPLSAAVLKVAGNDDYLSRLYIYESGNQWANVYVAYSARPRTMLGHRPQVCYKGAGWIADEMQESIFFTKSGLAVPCLVHRFHKPAPDNTSVVVLNYYILNGEFTNNEGGFTGLSWRTPNISGNAARYITQVQISSVIEKSVRSAAEDLTDTIRDFFPDEDGAVRVAEHLDN